MYGNCENLEPADLQALCRALATLNRLQTVSLSHTAVQLNALAPFVHHEALRNLNVSDVPAQLIPEQSLSTLPQLQTIGIGHKEYRRSEQAAPTNSPVR